MIDPKSTLLVAACLLFSAPAAATEPVRPVVAPPRAPAPTFTPVAVTIAPAVFAAFGTKLDTFRNGLAPEERRVIDGIVDRAGGLASDANDGEPTRKPARIASFERTDLDAPTVGGNIRGALGLAAPVRPQAGGGNVSLGPKQDDPMPVPPSKVALGPKQDDPAPPPPDTMASVTNKVFAFAKSLSNDEKALLGAIFFRASQAGMSNASGPGGCFPPIGHVTNARTNLASTALGVRLVDAGGRASLVRAGVALTGGLTLAPSAITFAPAPGGMPR